MLDYHIHYHRHGESGPYRLERVRDICSFAAERGLLEVGLSEHIFRFVEFREVVRDWWNHTDDDPRLKDHCRQYFDEHATQSISDYLDLAAQARACGLPVVWGLEVDYYPGRMEAVADFLAGLGLDYVLGSVHWIGAWGFDNEDVLDEWEQRDPDEVYRRYYELLLELAGTGVPTVLAHPDLVKKFGHAPRSFDTSEVFSDLVEVCKSTGIGLEVSSAGWRVPAGEQYPAVQLLERAVAAGLRLTTASDAHVPELVGHRVDDLCRLIGDLGGDRIYGYRHGEAVPVALEGASDRTSSLGGESDLSRSSPAGSETVSYRPHGDGEL